MMDVEFLSEFHRDIKKIKSREIKRRLIETIAMIKSIKHPREIPNLKKMSILPNAFRIRIGDYRVGIFIESEKVIFARIAHRKDIYKIFP